VHSTFPSFLRFGTRTSPIVISVVRHSPFQVRTSERTAALLRSMRSLAASPRMNSTSGIRHAHRPRNGLETQERIGEERRMNATQTWSAVVRWGRTGCRPHRVAVLPHHLNRFPSPIGWERVPQACEDGLGEEPIPIQPRIPRHVLLHSAFCLQMTSPARARRWANWSRRSPTSAANSNSPWTFPTRYEPLSI